MTRLLISISSIWAFVIVASASESLYINNPSFEDIVLPDGGSSNFVYNPHLSEYPHSNIDGANVCRLPIPDESQSFSSIDMNSTNILMPNSLYVLTLEKGNPEGFEYGTATIELLAGTNVLVSAGGSEPPTGFIYTMTVPVAVSNNHAALGDAITVRLKNSGPGTVDYDNINITRYTHSPEISIHISESDELLVVEQNLIPNIRYILEGKPDLDPDSAPFFSSSQVAPAPVRTNSLGLIEYNPNQAFFSLDLLDSFYFGAPKGLPLPE